MNNVSHIIESILNLYKVTIIIQLCIQKNYKIQQIVINTNALYLI